jgi:rhamnosyltransferase
MADRTPIDIIMGTYNGSQFLSAQIDSLFAQTHRKWRLLVRDDGSADNTISLLKAASDKDSRIHIVADSLGNLGVNGNFSHLLALSTAPYVMYCDQDDVWLPKKIELTLKEMLFAERDAPGKPVLVHCDATVTDSNLAIVRRHFIGVRGRLKGVSALLFANCVQGAAAMINTQLRERALRVQSILPYDYHLGVIAAATGQRRFIDQALLLYRQHSSNAIGAGTFVDNWHHPPLSAKVARTLQVAINAFTDIQKTLRCFSSEFSTETVEELDDFSQLLFGEDTVRRLFIAVRRPYGFSRRRDRLNLLLYIFHVNNI